MTHIVLFLVLAALILYAAQRFSRGRAFGLWASTALMLAWVVLLIALALRGISARHWPLGSQYEFALGFVWIVLTVHILAESYWQDRSAGPFVCIILLFLLVRAVTTPAQNSAIAPLPPVLRSVWLQVHVLTIMIGYGACSVAAAVALASLFGGTADERSAESQAHLHTLGHRLRPITERMLAIGFPWLTLGILTGAVWAYQAWGRYWGWDPKETWALIVWLWYLLLLHVRPLRPWQGRRFNWLVLIGFGLVMFTFIGVPSLARTLQLDTLHGY